MKQILHNSMAVMGMAIFPIIVFRAIFGPWIVPYDISRASVKEVFQSPSARYLFGTDNLGRNIFSRLLVGAKHSLMIGLGAEVIALFGSLIVSSTTGFLDQRVDDMIMRLCDMVQSISGMVLNIVLVTVLGLGIVPCFLALGTGGTAGNARTVRANIPKIRKNEFVDAASSVNHSMPRIIICHVLPNTISSMTVSATMDTIRNIMAASSLSCLGSDVQPLDPEWGAMLSAGKSYILNYPYMCLAPGIVIVITVLSLSLIGDGLRDALDSRLEK